MRSQLTRDETAVPRLRPDDNAMSPGLICVLGETSNNPVKLRRMCVALGPCGDRRYDENRNRYDRQAIGDPGDSAVVTKRHTETAHCAPVQQVRCQRQS